jgi:hypothetical protein
VSLLNQFNTGLREARAPVSIHINTTTMAAAPPVCKTAEAKGQSKTTFDTPVNNCNTKHAKSQLAARVIARARRKANASQAK